MSLVSSHILNFLQLRSTFYMFLIIYFFGQDECMISLSPNKRGEDRQIDGKGKYHRKNTRYKKLGGLRPSFKRDPSMPFF